MKKLLTLIVFFLAFSVSLNAQEDKKQAALIKAKSDTQAIANYLKLDGEAINDFYNIFKQKHEFLMQDGLSDERKQILSKGIERKIYASLTDEQKKMMESNPKLMNILTH